MTAVAAVGRRYLPRGWGHLGLQLAIWFGFLAVYQVARGVADRDPARAIANGLAVIDWERDARAPPLRAHVPEHRQLVGRARVGGVVDVLDARSSRSSG